MAQYPILRLTKGSALTYVEMDSNLTWLSSNLSGSNIYITGSSVNITGSTTIAGDLIVRGTGSFDVFVTNYYSSSIIYSSGSTKFGDTLDDTHQFTGSVFITGSTISLQGGNFSGSGANLFNIPASGITGLNLSRIATGSITASVDTNISASFRLVSGSNTLFNVDHVGRTWIGNGTAVNAGYQFDVNGTARMQNTLTISAGGANITGSVNITGTLNAPAAASNHQIGNIQIINSGNAGSTGIGISTQDSAFQFQGYSGGINLTNPAYFGFRQWNNQATTLNFSSSGIIRVYNIGWIDGNQNNVSGNSLWLQPIYNFAGTRTGITVRGFYYDPVLTSLTNTIHRAIETTTGDVLFGTASGSVGIGANTSINASAILDITSTTKGFLPTRTATTASITTPVQGLLTYLTASGDVEGLWQYRTGSGGWVQFLHNSSSIPASSIVGLNLSRITTGSVTASVSTGVNLFNVRSGSISYFNILNTGQQVISSPTVILSSSDSGYLISQSLSQSGSTEFSKIVGVNITPTFFSTTSSQTETALRVSPTFTGSYSGSLASNIIVDFGTSTSGSLLLIDDVTSGSVYTVNDYVGLPVLEVTSDAQVNMYDYPYAVFNKSASYISLGLPSTFAIDSAVYLRADIVMDEGFNFSSRIAQGNGTTLNDSTASLYTFTFGTNTGSAHVNAVITGYDSASRATISGEIKSTIKCLSGVASIIGTNFRYINAENAGVNIDLTVTSNTFSVKAYGTGSRTYIWGATVTTQVI